MENKKFGVLSSSTNPNSLADSVKGAIVLCSGLIIVLGQYFGVPLTETTVMEVASQSGVAVGAIWAIYGLLKKVLVRVVK